MRLISTISSPSSKTTIFSGSFFLLLLLLVCSVKRNRGNSGVCVFVGACVSLACLCEQKGRKKKRNRPFLYRRFRRQRPAPDTTDQESPFVNGDGAPVVVFWVIVSKGKVDLIFEVNTQQGLWCRFQSMRLSYQKFGTVPPCFRDYKYNQK